MIFIERTAVRWAGSVLFVVGFVVTFGSTSPSARGQGRAGHDRMVAELAALIPKVRQGHFYLGEKAAPEMRRALSENGESMPIWQLWELHLKLGEEEQRLGNESAAINHFETALELLPRVREDLAHEWIVRLYFRLGMAYLRFGETKNCAEGHQAEACILPIRGGGIHLDRAPARRAKGFFLEALERAEPFSDPYLTSLWLLNIAAMSIGDYPEGVPPDYRIAPERLESEVEFPRFDNVASMVGVDTFSLSGGVVADDFNLDGRLDLMVSSYAPDGQIRVFIQSPAGAFVDRTATSGLIGIIGGLNLVQADYDDDGDPDVLVLRGAWLGALGNHPNSLLRNNGDGTFTDVTFDSGLGEVHYPTQTAAWADYDLDGDLDLFVGNETNEVSAPCQLFQNQGDGRFLDVASSAGVTNDRFTKGVAWGDFDADGDPDLYVSNLDDENRLYRNDQSEGFVDVASELGVTAPIKSFPVWFWDYDNDGRLDLFVSAYEALIGDLANHYLGREFSAETPRLYRNTPRGFVDVSREQGLTAPSAPMGANFGDLDSDGFLDFYLGTGYPPYFALMPNLMYWNREGAGFSDITTSGGFGHLQKGHAVAFADLDGDGDQDVFEQLGGALAGDRFMDALFENPGFGNDWLRVHLIGRESARSAIGAKIVVHAEQDDGSRLSVHREVTSGGSFGANPLAQHIGLGRSRRILSMEIQWPSGLTSRFDDLTPATTVVIKEAYRTPRVLKHVYSSFSERELPPGEEPREHRSGRGGGAHDPP